MFLYKVCVGLRLLEFERVQVEDRQVIGFYTSLDIPLPSGLVCLFSPLNGRGLFFCF